MPSEGEIAYIQDKIESELEHGVVNDDTRREFVAIIESMKQREGIQQVVLGAPNSRFCSTTSSAPYPA